MQPLRALATAVLALTAAGSLTMMAASVAVTAHAQQAESAGSDWSTLPEALRPRLEPLATQWPQWSEQQREQVRQRAIRWLKLTPEEQNEAVLRLQRWQALGPPRQAALRQNLPHWETLGAERRQRLQTLLRKFEQRPDSERAALLSAFDALGSAARRALLPALPDSALSRLARELFVFVPIDERKATLRMLGELSDSAMLDLRALVEHRAPWQNEALRRELLEQPSQQREAWLSKRRASR